jgi:hypothetical protein
MVRALAAEPPSRVRAVAIHSVFMSNIPSWTGLNACANDANGRHQKLCDEDHSCGSLNSADGVGDADVTHVAAPAAGGGACSPVSSASAPSLKTLPKLIGLAGIALGD